MKHYFKDFGAGLATSLAMPPFFLFPLGLGGIAYLFHRLCVKKSYLKAHGFVVAFAFGFGLFLGGCWWITSALFFEKEKFLWLLVPTLVLGPALLALFTAIAGAIFWSIKTKGFPMSLGVWVFASLWAFSEWLRGAVFPYFNWNPLASIWSFSEYTMQAASVVGQTGLSFLTAALGASLIIPKWRVWGIGGAVAVVMLGAVSIQLSPPKMSSTKLYIVQPAIPQKERWDKHFANFNLRYQMTANALKNEPPKGKAIILWGETASPYPLESNNQPTKIIADILPPNSIAVVGYIHKNAQDKFHNALAVINPDATISDIYHKTHLVPFGEYLPFRWWMEKLLGLNETIGGKDFTSGQTKKIITLKNHPSFIPLICFESIFPLPVANTQWVLNATNDGWFGKTPGPYQHFAAARMRAVESGFSLVRAADGGISAIIDGKGRVLKRLKLGERGVITANLPLSKPTIYNQFGVFFTLLWILLWTLMLSLWLIISKRRVKNK